jgi:ribosomal protein S18 acetylase RimI-like enzyme
MPIPGLSIDAMTPGDLDFAAACTAAEGWLSEGRDEFEAFHAHDPGGCLRATLAGAPAGICIATAYGASGFIGELIVLPAQRGRGIGGALMAAAIDHLEHRGVRSIFLDGVSAAVPLYERHGFRRQCRSLRFSATAAALRGRLVDDGNVRAMQPDDLARIAPLDAAAFGADRTFFLARRLARFPRLCRIAERDGEPRSFIMGREHGGLVSAGPWIVADEPAAPQALLASLLPHARERLALGVLETQRRVVGSLRALGFGETADPPWRMLRGEEAALGAAPAAWAIGSAAKG